MRIVLLSMLVCFTASSVFSQSPDLSKKQDVKQSKVAGPKDDLKQKKETVTQVIYTCAMHPEIVQDKGGKCPTCGMNLDKKSVAKVNYTCPMHKEVSQDKAGKCPKCKMNLVINVPSKQENPLKK